MWSEVSLMPMESTQWLKPGSYHWPADETPKALTTILFSNSIIFNLSQDTGRELMPTDIKLYQMFGGEKVGY